MQKIINLKIQIIVLLLLVVFDQMTKMAMADNFALYQGLKITSFFNLTLVHNYGAAFGFLNDQPGWQRWFFTAVSSAAVIFVSIWIYRLETKDKILRWGLTFILVGAIGNLIDRVLFGYVIDFLDFYYKTYHWPAFNVADSSIFIGVVFFIVDSFKQK